RPGAVPAGGRQLGHRSGHQHRGQASQPRDALVGLRRGLSAVPRDVPQLAGGPLRGLAADAHVHSVRSIDGVAGDRGEGGDVAGDCPRRGHRRRLCAVRDEHCPGRNAPWVDPFPSLLQSAAVHRK
nr:hypothetical protein [Tanacetum cinerariifolium]